MVWARSTSVDSCLTGSKKAGDSNRVSGANGRADGFSPEEIVTDSIAGRVSQAVVFKVGRQPTIVVDLLDLPVRLRGTPCPVLCTFANGGFPLERQAIGELQPDAQVAIDPPAGPHIGRGSQMTDRRFQVLLRHGMQVVAV
jgi:hypothetical protein